MDISTDRCYSYYSRILVIIKPGTTLALLGAFFIAGFLVSGIFEIIFALANKNTLKGWGGWTLASGIIDILFALLLLAMPISTIAVLLFMVGFWVMFQSIWAIGGGAIELQRNSVKGWGGWILTFGILGVILSFILIANLYLLPDLLFICWLLPCSAMAFYVSITDSGSAIFIKILRKNKEHLANI